MNHRFTFPVIGLLIVAIIAVVGCASTPTPVPPTIVPTAVPTSVPPPTAAPTNTSLPPTPTTAPTVTPPPATNTPIPTTPAPTATNTRPPVTRQPTAVPTATTVPLKFAAPQLTAPAADSTFRTGKDDLVFTWQPVGALAADECYLVTVRITNTVDNQFAELSYMAQNTCNDSGTAPVQFSLSKRAPAPDYAGLVAIANTANPATTFHVTWNVMVVQNKGADPNNAVPAKYVPLSPVSDTIQFNLNG